MRHLIEKHRTYWKRGDFVVSSIMGILLLIFSLGLNYITTQYATTHQSNSVTDILLDNTPTLNVDFIVVYGALVFIIFMTMLLLNDPKRIPFTLKSIALFIFVRSVFLSLTHLGYYPYRSGLHSSPFFRALGISQTSAFFFSGHTGIPYLLALMFWSHKNLRSFFLFTSVLFATSVILGHLHYSIDVFSAYFMTYTIYHLALKFFEKDYQLFKHGNNPPC